MLPITSFLILLYRYCEKAELFSLLCNSSIHMASGQHIDHTYARFRVHQAHLPQTRGQVS